MSRAPGTRDVRRAREAVARVQRVAIRPMVASVRHAIKPAGTGGPREARHRRRGRCSARTWLNSADTVTTRGEQRSDHDAQVRPKEQLRYGYTQPRQRLEVHPACLRQALRLLEALQGGSRQWAKQAIDIAVVVAEAHQRGLYPYDHHGKVLLRRSRKDLRGTRNLLRNRLCRRRRRTWDGLRCRWRHRRSRPGPRSPTTRPVASMAAMGAVTPVSCVAIIGATVQSIRKEHRAFIPGRTCLFGLIRIESAACSGGRCRDRTCRDCDPPPPSLTLAVRSGTHPSPHLN